MDQPHFININFKFIYFYTFFISLAHSLNILYTLFTYYSHIMHILFTHYSHIIHIFFIHCPHFIHPQSRFMIALYSFINGILCTHYLHIIYTLFTHYSHILYISSMYNEAPTLTYISLVPPLSVTHIVYTLFTHSSHIVYRISRRNGNILNTLFTHSRHIASGRTLIFARLMDEITSFCSSMPSRRRYIFDTQYVKNIPHIMYTRYTLCTECLNIT